LFCGAPKASKLWVAKDILSMQLTNYMFYGAPKASNPWLAIDISSTQFTNFRRQFFAGLLFAVLSKFNLSGGGIFTDYG